MVGGKWPKRFHFNASWQFGNSCHLTACASYKNNNYSQPATNAFHKLFKWKWVSDIWSSKYINIARPSKAIWLSPATPSDSNICVHWGTLKILMLIYVTLNVVIHCTSLSNSLPQDCCHGKASALSAQRYPNDFNDIHYMWYTFAKLILVLPMLVARPVNVGGTYHFNRR